jgi:hypothetical protein
MKLKLTPTELADLAKDWASRLYKTKNVSAVYEDGEIVLEITPESNPFALDAVQSEHFTAIGKKLQQLSKQPVEIDHSPIFSDAKTPL